MSINGVVLLVLASASEGHATVACSNDLILDVVIKNPQIFVLGGAVCLRCQHDSYDINGELLGLECTQLSMHLNRVNLLEQVALELSELQAKTMSSTGERCMLIAPVSMKVLHFCVIMS